MAWEGSSARLVQVPLREADEALCGCGGPGGGSSANQRWVPMVPRRHQATSADCTTTGTTTRSVRLGGLGGTGGALTLAQRATTTS